MCNCLQTADKLMKGAVKARDAGDMAAFVELMVAAAQYIHAAKQVDRARAALPKGGA